MLSIVRAASMEQVGPTKTRRSRRLTVGATTAALWRDLVQAWSVRAGDEHLGEWLFSRDLAHRTRLSTSFLARSFARLCTSAGVPDVSLHRLRHGVATFLVDRGEILKAQQRLGHRDASTTLRNYAHALPLEDQAVADAIDGLLAGSNLTDHADSRVAQSGGAGQAASTSDAPAGLTVWAVVPRAELGSEEDHAAEIPEIHRVSGDDEIVDV